MDWPKSFDQFEQKTLDGSVLDVDDKTRRVKTAWNKTGVLDHDKDIIEKSAFDKTIKENGPKSKNLIWHLTDHKPSLKDAVGKPSEIIMEGDFLVAITDIPKTSWGNDVLEFYKTATINQHSIGFSTVKREVFNDDDWEKRYTVIKEVKLYEGSAVLWGANEHTPTLSVGKSLTKEDSEKEFLKINTELDSFAKLFKSGHLSDQAFELIELRMIQLTSTLQQLFETTTRPAQKAVEPVKESLLDVFKTFNNSLNSTANDPRRIEVAA
jgi:HK97 family phage prohead protease